MEIYKHVVDFPNYSVSNLGNIKNKKGKILKPYISFGYHRFLLSEKRLRKRFFIHRLVAIAFIPNPENKPEVNHKDGNKSNNCIENLEWCTSSENSMHAFKMGLNINVGVNNVMTKLTEKDVLEIRRLKTGNTISKLSKMFNVSPSTISYIVNNRTWKHLL